MTEPQPQTNLVHDIFMLAREMRNAIDHELGPHGITAQQAALVLVAQVHEGCGVSHLAGVLGADAAGITRLVDRLEAKGIVARFEAPNDRRMVVVRTTPSGAGLTSDLRDGFERAHERLLDGLTPEEIDQFRALVARLRQNLADGDQEVDA